MSTFNRTRFLLSIHNISAINNCRLIENDNRIFLNTLPCWRRTGANTHVQRSFVSLTRQIAAELTRKKENSTMAGACGETSKRPSSDMAAFREHFAKAKHILVLTGAGVSAESGVPTFRGAGGFWRKFQAQHLATPDAFADDPSLVWEFYHYRREVMLSKFPNDAHKAIAECEKRLEKQNRKVVVVTQNIDELHARSGSKDIVELHGNLFTTRCMKCGDVTKNYDSPICEALRGKGEPDPSTVDAKIPESQLPRCKKDNCGGLLRPHVVWFGEGLDASVLSRAGDECDQCDLCLVVGTSSVVYPAAMFAPSISARGVPVAEFNPEETDVTNNFGFHFHGPAGQFLPQALARHETEK